MTRARAALAAAVLLAAPLTSCRRDPRAPLRLAAGTENHDFAVDLAHGRALYIEGTYPRKSYLHVEPLAGAWRSPSFRVKGASLTGHVFPMKDGRHALVEALRTMGPGGPQLLEVDLQDGSIVEEYPLKGMSVRRLAQPRWSKVPIAAVQDDSGLRLAPLEPGADLTKGVLIAADATGRTALADDYPVIAVASWNQTGQGTLRLFDASSGKRGREVGVRAPSQLLPLEGGRWLLSLEDDKSRDTTMVELDGTLGKAKPLFSSRDSVETAVAGRRWLYAVAASTSPRAESDAHFLHPRELHRVDLTGAEPPLTIPWTKRFGELLALDEDANRLYFAVEDTDDPGIWSLDASPERLAAAAARMDRGGRLPLGLLSAVALSVTLAASVIGVLWLLLEGPR